MMTQLKMWAHVSGPSTVQGGCRFAREHALFLIGRRALAACADTGFGLDMITEMMYQVFG